MSAPEYEFIDKINPKYSQEYPKVPRLQLGSAESPINDPRTEESQMSYTFNSEEPVQKATINIGKGDVDGLGQLYSTHQAPLFRFAFARLRNYHDAEDVVAEAFSSALSYITDRDEITNASRWIFTTAHYLILQRYRHQTRHGIYSLDKETDAVSGLAIEDPFLPIDNRLAMQPDVERLQEAWPHLVSGQQNVLELFYGQGLQEAEVAVLLGKKTVGVRTQKFRAIEKLRTLLGLSKPQSRKEQLADLVATRYDRLRTKDSWTAKELARLLGVRPEYILYLHNLGLPAIKTDEKIGNQTRSFYQTEDIIAFFSQYQNND